LINDAGDVIGMLDFTACGTAGHGISCFLPDFLDECDARAGREPRECIVEHAVAITAVRLNIE
jgi:hypothetical protein